MDSNEKYKLDTSIQDKESMFKTATEDELDVTVGEIQEEGSVSSDGEDWNEMPCRWSQLKQLDKVTLELPTKDLLTEAAPLVARLKLSVRATTSLFAKIITMGGGDLKGFAFSRNTTWRQKIKKENEAETKLNLKFQESLEKHPYVIMQWDAKKVKFKSGIEEERLVICVQNVSDKEQQFIGAPSMQDGTGLSQCDALVRYIDNAGIENLLIGHVWDTTASNSGPHNGSVIRLERSLDKALLWLGCRRHIAERHCVHAYLAIRGKTSGQNI